MNSTVMLRGVEYLLQRLVELGVDSVFAVPGKQIDSLFDELCRSNKISVFTASHELGAAYMAEGYARASGRLGVVCCISSPGFSNLFTALQDSYHERIPLLILSGHVGRTHRRTSGFQTIPFGHRGGTEPGSDFAKYSAYVEHRRQLESRFEDAVRAATSYPFGPAHLTLGREALEDSAPRVPRKFPEAKAKPVPSRLLKWVAQTVKMVVLVGESLNAFPGAKAALQALARRHHIPYACTLGSLRFQDRDDPLFVGVFGYAGHPATAEFVLRPDVAVLMLGVDYSERNTLQWDARFQAAGKRVARVGVGRDRWPVGRGPRHFELSPLHALEALERAAFVPEGTLFRKAWVAEQGTPWRLIPLPRPTRDRLEPMDLVAGMEEKVPQGTSLFVDAGLHKAFSPWMRVAGEVFVSHRLSPMGWGLAAGLGAATRPKAPRAVVLTGDGCLLMHGMELVPAVRYNLPVVIVLMNNGRLGAVHRRAERLQRHESSSHLLIDVDWERFAESISLPCRTVADRESLSRALSEAFGAKTPFLINALCVGDAQIPFEESLF